MRFMTKCDHSFLCARHAALLLGALLIGSVLTPAHAQLGSQKAKFLADDGGASDQFGYAVGISGTTAIVGTWKDDDNGIDSGSAYLYNTNTGAQISKLLPDDGAAGDLFGISVAIDGNTAIVGASEQDTNGVRAGAAYLFNATTGAQIAKLLPIGGGAVDKFGTSVGISGNIAIVGAPDNSDDGSTLGAAYLFNATTGQQFAQLQRDDIQIVGTGGNFGFAVAINGTTAIIGSRKSETIAPFSGSAYLFDVTNPANPFQTHKLVPLDGAIHDMFGWSVGISGTIAIVGAQYHDDNGSDSGAAYLFDTTTGQQTAELLPSDATEKDEFGHSVAISGNIAIVGAHHDRVDGLSRAGSAYLFNALTGVQITKLQPLGPAAPGGLLGESVAISGANAIVGEPNRRTNTILTGAAYLFVTDPDTDGDGLLDSWETDGIPYTGIDGSDLRFILPDADPMHKNLYVEVDSMAGFPLDPAAIERVVFAFEASPLTNPNLFDGVTLTVLLDETDLPHVALWQSVDSWPIDHENYRDNSFGTPAERGNPNAVALLEAKALAYRYCIAANDSAPRTIGGAAKSIPGDNFVIYIDGYGEKEQAAVFMHELGHCLNLHHGGDDDVNGKPNYPSIMNYVLSYEAPWNEGFWKLDYSREDAGNLGYLDESALDETAGIGTPTGQYFDYKMPFGVNEPDGFGGTVREVKYLTLNGSPMDFGSPDGSMFQDGEFDLSVAQDLNFAVNAPPGIDLPTFPSPDQPLAPFNDWEHVTLPLLEAMGDSAPATSPMPDDELTDEAVAWIEANFPIPPSKCPADTNGDGILDLGDVNTFVTLFLAQDIAADFNGDGILDLGDISVFVSFFLAGC